jgi:hypothetical protein
MSLEEEINEMPIEKLRSTLLMIMRDNVLEDTDVREIASTVLPEIDCYGDSYGVPTLYDIVDKLVERIQNG